MTVAYIETTISISVLLWLMFIIKQIPSEDGELPDINTNISPLTRLQVRTFLGIQVIVLIWMCYVDGDIRTLQHLFVLYITWTVHMMSVYDE